MEDIKRLLWEAYTEGYKCPSSDPAAQFTAWFNLIDIKAWLIAGAAAQEIKTNDSICTQLS